MDSQQPISVFFGRSRYAPSQLTIDHGVAGAASVASLLGGYAGALLILFPLPPATSGAFLLHLKGTVGMVAARFLPTAAAWSQLWLDHLATLDAVARLGLAGKIAVSISVGVGLAIQTWRRTARPIDGFIHIRGRRLLEGSDAIRAATAMMKMEIGKDASKADLWIHPKVRFSTARMAAHGLLVGKVGGGKTTCLLPMLSQVIVGGFKGLVFDIKGDFTSKFYTGPKGPVALLAPWDKRSLVWDIARDCRTRAEAVRFASYLIKESKDPMWSAAARQLCVGFLVHLQQTRGERWGWKDLADMLSTPEAELVTIMRQSNPEAIRAVEQTGTTTTGILINLSAFMSVIFDLADAWPEPIQGRMFSIQDWIFNEKTRHRVIFLGGNKEFGPLMSSFISALIAQAAACVCSPRLKESRTRRLYFILDEFPQLGKIDIEPLIAVGRSKGARVWLGLQDFGQLKKIYGQDEAQAIAAMVGTILCAGAAPGETAKLISDMAGQREVERGNLSSSIQGGVSAASTSHSWQREMIPVLTESQACSLGVVAGRREIRALLLNYGEDALILRWPFDERPTIAEPVLLAAWTRPTAERMALAQQQAELDAIATLEGEDRIEAERRLAVSRDIAELARNPPTPEPFSADRASHWLEESTRNIEPQPIPPSADTVPAESPSFIVDAPSAADSTEREREVGTEDPLEDAAGHVTERFFEASADRLGFPDAGGLAGGMLKLAEAYDALKQPVGPTKQQAPVQRRIN